MTWFVLLPMGGQALLWLRSHGMGDFAIAQGDVNPFWLILGPVDNGRTSKSQTDSLVMNDAGPLESFTVRTFVNR